MRHGGVPQNIRLMGCRVRLPVRTAVCQIASTVCQMGGCSFGEVVPPSVARRVSLVTRGCFRLAHSRCVIDDVIFLIWLVACQSLIGTKSDQQICTRQ